MKLDNENIEMITPDNYEPLAQKILNFISNEYGRRNPTPIECAIMVAALECVKTAITNSLREEGVELTPMSMPLGHQ